MPERPHGTVAFLFTDIAGSTRLWRDHREAMERAYTRHDALLRTAITAHRGVIYKVIGDAFQAAFPTVPEAVAAALEAQRGLVAEDWTGSGLPEPLRIRMAVHVGDVDPDPDGDYRSPVLNRVGRLLGTGHGGQVLLSAGAAFLARDRLPERAGLRDLGPHRLKDLLEPEPIFQLLHLELPADFPPLLTLDRRSHNLPLQPTLFLGREREVEQVVALLKRHDIRLLTLTGPGGTGKTRLGLQVAAEVLEDFVDGVFFVPLAPLTDPALVPSAMAEALGIREEGGQPLRERLQEYLATKQQLLVLDNFEQVTGAATIVGDLLSTSPGLKALATSRVPLHLRGEQEYAVPTLNLPRRKPPPTLEQMTQFEAVRLFIVRAQAVRADFTVSNENAPAVAEICHRLDGLPLAIELAAARIRMLSPQAMLSRLEHRLPLLTGGAQDAPARQQTLRNAIAWSYDLLSPEEQTLFRRLAVFAGGATFEAIEAVANAEGELDVFTELVSLVDKSLVRQREEGYEPRFTMLETIREFGLEHLEASGDAEETWQRHADYFLQLTEAAEPQLGGLVQRLWLDRLEAEYDNLRAALGWGLERDAVRVLQMASRLTRFWESRGFLSEGRDWLARALARTEGASTRNRTQALNRAAWLAWTQGDYPRAVTLAEEAFICSRTDHNDQGIADALTTLGAVARVRGELERGTALAMEGLARYRAVGDDAGAAWALVGLGNLVSAAGNLVRATTYYEEAVALHRQLGDTVRTAISLSNLGNTWYMRGSLSQAVALLEEAAALTREMGAKQYIAGVVSNLGEVVLGLGDIPRAASLYRESLELWDHVERHGHPAILAGLGGVAAMAGQAEQAARLFGAATAISETLGVPFEPLEQTALDQRAAAVHETLGEAAFAATWEVGYKLSVEQAVAAAVATADELVMSLALGARSGFPDPSNGQTVPTRARGRG